MPLARFGLVDEHGGQKQQSKRLFVQTMHHAFYDGMSVGLALEQLQRAFRGKILVHPPPFQGLIRHVTNVDQDDAAKA